MSVDDHGLEAIRKSAGEVTPGNNTEYFILTKIKDAIEGSFTPSGLTIGQKNTVLSIGTSALPIPATSLTDRNTMAVHNKGTSTLYLGDSSVTADDAATTGGWELPAGEKIFVDISDGIPLYGIRASLTEAVKVWEIA